MTKEKFLEKIKVNDNGCWEWQSTIDTGGYGQLKEHGKILSAHRLAYELFKGAIPQGLTIDHLCRNRRCVNPDHLEVVTMRENILRGNGVTAMNARATHCVNGHPFDLFNTYFLSVGWRHCRICAAERKQRWEELHKMNSDASPTGGR